jgi:ribose/xylose/arabinose/galactoside ABC-type transport system permease subunit
MGFFVLMLFVFMVLKPSVFLHLPIYGAVFISLPLIMIMAVSLVFVIAVGEVDLSFGGAIALSGLAFARVVASGINPVVGIGAAVLVGVLIGLANGFFVTRLKLSSIVVTLGMLYFANGLNYLITNGNNVNLIFLDKTSFSNVFIRKFDILGLAFPVQMLWGIAIALGAWLLFNRHRFGAQVCCVGDNPDSAKEMGINVARVKTMTFVVVGVAAAVVGVLTTLISHTFYPSLGEEWLLPALAAVFVGGTPSWGGIGTVAGALFGAATVAFIGTGVIAVGGSGFYLKFFYGLIVILSIVGQRFNRSKSRY